MTFLEFLLGGTLFLLGVLLLLAGAARKKEEAARKKGRADSLREWGEKRGFSFSVREDPTLHPRFPRSRLYMQGTGRKTTNFLRGMIGDWARAEVFDFDFTFTRTGIPGEVRSYRQTIAILFASQADLPAFEIEPKRGGIRGALTKSPAYPLPETAETRDFWLHYQPFCRNEKAGTKLFSPRVLARLGSDPGWWIEGDGQWFLATRPGRILSPLEIPDFLERTGALLKVFLGKA